MSERKSLYGAAEEGVRFRDIAAAIGQAFGALAVFAAADSPASSARTRELTGWRPTGPDYFAAR